VGVSNRRTGSSRLTGCRLVNFNLRPKKSRRKTAKMSYYVLNSALRSAVCDLIPFFNQDLGTFPPVFFKMMFLQHRAL
jgi:hypothetical protein